MIEVIETPVTVEATQPKEATMPITTPQPSDLLQSLMKLLDEHIEKKVAEALAKHVEAVRDVAREVADEVISEHTDNYDHDEYDSLVSNLDERVSDAIYDYDLDDKIKDAVDAYDMEDKIKDTIRDMSFTVSVD